MSPILDVIIEAAIEAGSVVMRHYELGTTVCQKGDGSPVTEADRQAEAVILAALATLDPAIPVVAEEEVDAARVPASSARFFLVDPLDGTREFLSRNGEFTVNIALIEDGVPVVGVVFAPCLGRLFVGQPGEAWQAHVRDGQIVDRQPITVRPAPGSLRAVGSRSHGSPETADFLERFDVAEFVSRGSSLKFCLLAAGEADIYPRCGRTMEWDTAAGDAILRAAGGIVTTLDGLPLRYDKRAQESDADFANPYFVAYGDPDLAKRMACDRDDQRAAS